MESKEQDKWGEYRESLNSILNKKPNLKGFPYHKLGAEFKERPDLFEDIDMYPFGEKLCELFYAANRLGDTCMLDRYQVSNVIFETLGLDLYDDDRFTGDIDHELELFDNWCNYIANYVTNKEKFIAYFNHQLNNAAKRRQQALEEFSNSIEREIKDINIGIHEVNNLKHYYNAQLFLNPNIERTAEEIIDGVKYTPNDYDQRFIQLTETIAVKNAEGGKILYKEGSWISEDGDCFTREQLKEKEEIGDEERLQQIIGENEAREDNYTSTLPSETERLERIKEELRDIESMGGNVDIEEYLAEFPEGYISDSNMERTIYDYYNNDSRHR